MIMTTPNEFLQFAKEMGLEKIKSSTSSRAISNNDSYTTGLCVLNNLCCLIEQIHQLRAENDRLRAHLELDDRLEKFRQRFSIKDNHEDNEEKHNEIISLSTIPNEDKSTILSSSNSLKSQQTKSTHEQKGLHYVNHQEESSSIAPADHDQSELIDNNLGSTSVPTWNHWSKVRHALRFSLRRKHDYTTSPPLPHVDRQIPTISVLIESDDDHLQENKRSKKKKKKILATSDDRPTVVGDDSDQDDDSMQLVRAYHKRRLYGNDTATSSSTERQEASLTNIRSSTTNMEDEALLTRKQSKIARYRRKLRSKLDTVKRQFSDQNSSPATRLFHHSPGTTFEDIGSGLNHAMLTAQLAPALTKSYQQKMREWESMQKSHFLVNYRRQSIIPKNDLNSHSRKTSMVLILDETSTDPTSPSTTIDNYPSTIEESNLELDNNSLTLGPTLSPNQRSLIVHQWREIMSEEISLRHCQEYLQNKMLLLQDLETNLKRLKTNIFCTNYLIKQQSMLNITEYNRSEQSYLPQRCRSLQTLISIPTSWILAVQSAAYSDVLDGTSYKTTDRAIWFNKHFFDELEQFKQDRRKFEQDSIQDLQLLSRLKSKQKTTSDENRTRLRFVSTRGHLRKLSLMESFELPQYFLPDPVIPLQTTIAQIQPSSNAVYHPITKPCEIDANNQTASLLGDTPKRTKRSRFDFKETFHRSRSLCAAQINSWLQRRRQQHVSIQRRTSTTGCKITTPKLFSSPRLTDLHRRLFKHQASSLPPANRAPTPEQPLDDSDNRSQYDLPVRIYFPPLTAPITRHVRITDMNSIMGDDDDQDTDHEQTSHRTTPLLNRTYSSTSSSSSLRRTTAKDRRESYATLSNVFNNRCL